MGETMYDVYVHRFDSLGSPFLGATDPLSFSKN